MNYQDMKRHGGAPNAYYKVKEANMKGDMLSDSNYVTFCKSQNCGDSKKIIGCHALGRERNEQVESRGFLGQRQHSV